jgi:hypothetical protein
MVSIATDNGSMISAKGNIIMLTRGWVPNDIREVVRVIS